MFVIEVKDTKNVVQSIVFNICDTNHHVQNMYANPTALQPLIAKLRYTMRSFLNVISRTSEIPDLNKYALIRWKMTALFIYNKGPQTFSVLSACCDF